MISLLNHCLESKAHTCIMHQNEYCRRKHEYTVKRTIHCDPNDLWHHAIHTFSHNSFCKMKICICQTYISIYRTPYCHSINIIISDEYTLKRNLSNWYYPPYLINCTSCLNITWIDIEHCVAMGYNSPLLQWVCTNDLPSLQHVIHSTFLDDYWTIPRIRPTLQALKDRESLTTL